MDGYLPHEEWVWTLEAIRQRDAEWVEGRGGEEALPAQRRTDLMRHETPFEALDRHDLVRRLDALVAYTRLATSLTAPRASDGTTPLLCNCGNTTFRIARADCFVCTGCHQEWESPSLGVVAAFVDERGAIWPRPPTPPGAREPAS